MIHRSVPAIRAQATLIARQLRSLFSTQRRMRVLHILAPSLVTLSFGGIAHAQGTMDFSGAQTLMGTFNVGTAAIQSQVIYANPSKAVTEQFVRAFQGQITCLRDL